MPTNNSQAGVLDTNPQAIKAIVKASDRYSIVASQDIVDERGMKLLAKGQTVSQSLQQRLLERKLSKPLEACLVAEDGVTLHKIQTELESFLSEDNAFAKGLGQWAPALIKQAPYLPFHSVAQLLMTTNLANRQDTLAHAVRAMALAGAMAARQGSLVDIRLAMLGGLLHDIGEVYIDPRYLDQSVRLDVIGYKNLVVHPRVAQMLLDANTDYPQVLTRAIGEHHERLDGSGYPSRLPGDSVSNLGRILAIVEVTLGILRAPNAPLTRASFALRVIPGEFDSGLAGFVCDIARNSGEILEPHPNQNAGANTPPLDEIDRHTRVAEGIADMLNSLKASGLAVAIVGTALKRLNRLRVAWNELGLWGMDAAELTPQERVEADMADRELQQHMRELKRECMLLSDRLAEVEKGLLEPLWEGLLEKR